MSGSAIDDDAESLYEAELALDGADLRRPTWTVERDQSAYARHRGHRRRRHVGHHRRAPAPPSRRRGRRVREERRRRRHVARERLPGLPRRHPEPLLQLRDRADARLAAVPLAAAGAARLLPYVHRAFRRRRLHSLLDRSARRALGRDRLRLVRRHVVGGPRTGDAPARCARVRDRTAQPAARCPTSKASTTSPGRRSTRPGGTGPSTCATSGSP